MIKKYYVDGGIAVDTPFFYCKGCGAKYDECPDGAIVLETNAEELGSKYLLINDDNPQSFFAEYYARTFFSTRYGWSSYFYDDFQKIYDDYCASVNRILRLAMTGDRAFDEEDLTSFYNMLFLSVITAVDSFVASVVVYGMVQEEDAFIKVACETDRNFKNLSPEEIIGCAKREWQVVKNVLKTSFSSCERIKKILRCIGVFDWNGQDRVLENMDRHFLSRHCLIHRGGRKIDGTQLIVSKDDLSIVVEDSNRLALTVLTLLER